MSGADRPAARTGGPADLDHVARIWAAATAARDGLERPAPLRAARADMDEAIADGDHVLVVAGEPHPVAFALAVLDDGQATVIRVGVDPAHQRQGLGALVMTGLVECLRERDLPAAELYVYPDNLGAIALYEGLGWEPAPGADIPYSRIGKPQRRYRLALAAPGGSAGSRPSSEADASRSP